MIEYTTGNVIEADAEALVNTVNTVGVMGKGVALQFRQVYPDNYQAYKKACSRQEVQIGRMFVVPTGRIHHPHYIINFPTKRHWRNKSRLEDIEAGLQDLVDVLQEKAIQSVAIPPLGCGNGGLDWEEVRPRIEAALKGLSAIRAQIFEPVGTPNAEEMPVATPLPKMTLIQAALLKLFEAYLLPGYSLTKFEAMKLAYLLQVSGEPLHLRFVKQEYGPYAATLQRVLQGMEGHFIRGYGDRNRYSSIRLMPGVGVQVAHVLDGQNETLARLERVVRLMEGFENPRSLELLATIHWMAQEDRQVRDDKDAAIHAVWTWNEGKRRVFPEYQIRIAWERLKEQGWL